MESFSKDLSGVPWLFLLQCFVVVLSVGNITDFEGLRSYWQVQVSEGVGKERGMGLQCGIVIPVTIMLQSVSKVSYMGEGWISP